MVVRNGSRPHGIPGERQSISNCTGPSRSGIWVYRNPCAAAGVCPGASHTQPFPLWTFERRFRKSRNFEAVRLYQGSSHFRGAASVVHFNAVSFLRVSPGFQHSTAKRSLVLR